MWFQLVVKKSAPQTQARVIFGPIGTPCWTQKCPRDPTFHIAAGRLWPPMCVCSLYTKRGYWPFAPPHPSCVPRRPSRPKRTWGVCPAWPGPLGPLPAPPAGAELLVRIAHLAGAKPAFFGGCARCGGCKAADQTARTRINRRRTRPRLDARPVSRSRPRSRTGPCLGLVCFEEAPFSDLRHTVPRRAWTRPGHPGGWV